MIKFDRNENEIEPPASLTDPAKKGENDEALREERAESLNENRPMKFKSGIYGGKQVKGQLQKISQGKCSYCDKRVVDIEYGDVEHFRPKSVYWWLAYTWENLLYSCQLCNQQFKKDKFPITGDRASEPDSNLADEGQLLINPLDEDPEGYFDYDPADNVTVIPNERKDPKRAKACIGYYGLNRYELVESRRRAFKKLSLIIALMEDADTSEEGKEKAKELLLEMTSTGEDFAGMARYHLTKAGLTGNDANE